MFEARVLDLLRKYLGEYIHGLSAEALRISVWKGDVVLKDLQLKAEALNSLNLPVIVKAGFVGTITLKVPWKSLGKDPVIVLIDQVFALAHPAPDGHSLKEDDRIRLFEAKLRQIEEMEMATLDARARRLKLGDPPSGTSWLGSLIATVIGNLKISISNVHIRYEDSVSNPGHPFCSGITLSKLAAVTMDEQGNETFDTSGILDKLRKSLQLQRLAVYHDSDSFPWKINKKWEDMSPKEWIKIFEDGIKESSMNEVDSIWARNRRYLVSPINGVLKYHRLGRQERNNPEIPFEKASLVLSDVSLNISEAQYYDMIKLLEVFARYKTHVEVSHLRPVTPILEDPRAWWCYGAQAGLQQKKMCSYRFSWDRIRHLCLLRRRYIQLYACSLQQLSTVDQYQIREIEKDLDSKVILLWRLLAHAKVESAKSKEAAQLNSHLKKGWWSFVWRSTNGGDVTVDDPMGLETSALVNEEKLTKEEWSAINKILSYHSDDEVSTPLRYMQNMILFLINISIEQAAARIININGIEIVCGRFEKLHVSTKFHLKSTSCDVSLRFYGLSSPEGPLAQSVSSEKKVNALAASFVRSPIGEYIDWKLSATIAPCHVTVLMETYDRFTEFIRRSNAVSPTVALETANALQMKIGKVTRKAQEQFQMVLEEQSRFALDIDFDAPKVRVPIKTSASSNDQGQFLLDFGNFTLHTKECQCDEQNQSLYTRFFVSGKDIAAFFVDGSVVNQDCSIVPFDCEAHSFPTSIESDPFFSLIDRCGMAVIIDQIKVPHPSFPSSRVSIQVPNLGIHFSPARYFRIMDLMNLVYDTVEESTNITSGNDKMGTSAWHSVELSTDARILVWKGIGNSIAEWQPCFLVLSGFYLYVKESGVSQSYQRCCSMSGRQVFEVASSSVGGSLLSLAICFRGVDTQKALESASTMIIEFRDDEQKSSWLRELTSATYRASSPPSIDFLGESSDATSENVGCRPSGIANLVVSGALLETKMFLYGKVGDERHESLEERLILELNACGGKINLFRFDDDLIVKMKLHSLTIKDELQSSLSKTTQYLACSVLRDDILVSYPNMFEAKKKGPHEFLEEEETFNDALSDFFSTTELIFPQSPSGYFKRMGLFEINEHNTVARIHLDNASSLKKEAAKGRKINYDVFYEARDSDTADFVTVTFSSKQPGSPIYDGIDGQMNICMAKLDFFFNRPTIVTLIALGLDLSPSSSVMDNTQVQSLGKGENSEENRAPIKGVLGYGKDRVVFNLKMDVDSVSMYLNKEDGSQFAMLVQESFLLDVKIHPGSISVEGSLGNLKLCDMSLGSDNCWQWLCDTRNHGTESLIKFKFESYSIEDGDYMGYDYSLCCCLSAVRIVFLYRFIQEVIAYFFELATPRTEEAIKLVDKVGGFEWLIQKYEIDGASAIKLDLSLVTPLIIVPRNSFSNDFMQLDLGQLHVSNHFSWHGYQANDPSSVHLDILKAEIIGVNMAVGINGNVGIPIVREGQGFHIQVRRSLRDVFRKVPTMSVEIKVGLLHGVLSSKEYEVIVDCAYMNINEEPRLPPSFRANAVCPKDSVIVLSDSFNVSSQVFLSRTVSVEINYALLELRNGSDDDSPIAQIALEGLWVWYRSSSSSEADLYVTIPKFSILDVRPNTRPEMSLMLGSSIDVKKNNVFIYSESCGRFGTSQEYQSREVTMDEMDSPNVTMLLLDYKFRPGSQSYVIRVQQPHILVVIDFLLAVGEFFVPSLGVITGREELLDPRNDPIGKGGSIVLTEPIYNQRDDVVCLSANNKLIVDAPGIDEFIYDGCGKTLHFLHEQKLSLHSSSTALSFVIIGCGKKLRFRNVKIENGDLLRKHIYLNNGSSYSVSAEDGVSIMYDRLNSMVNLSCQEAKDFSHRSISASDPENTLNLPQSCTFEVQIVSPEFTFYDSSKTIVDDSLHVERLLRAKMDLSFMYAFKDNDTWIRGIVKDLCIEAGSGLTMVDPVDISGGYTSVKDKTSISMTLTDVYVHLSLGVISLALNLIDQADTALRFGNSSPLASCNNFDRICVLRQESNYNLTFWRPQAPPNYVILGDCVTSRPVPPSQSVLAVSNTYGRVRKPISFHLLGMLSNFSGPERNKESCNSNNSCSLWLPIAPEGYVSLGCLANIGCDPPPIHTVYCIRSDLVASTTFLDCILCIPSNSWCPSGFSIWHLDNVGGTFYAHPTIGSPPKSTIFDLSQSLLGSQDYTHSSHKSSSNHHTDHHVKDHQCNYQSSPRKWDFVKSLSVPNSYCVPTPTFERIWWDKGADFRSPVSIWRPLPHLGFSVFGDCITEGLEPPAVGIVFKCDNSGFSAKPLQFTKVAHIASKGIDEAFFWYPIAPPGYASMGCIVSRTDKPPLADSFCCLRIDLVKPTNILDIPISKSPNLKSAQCWSLWRVNNQINTFFARSDLKKPSNRLGYSIKDCMKPKTRENVNAEIKLRCFSLTVLDNMGGMMTPLFDMTITNVNLATHGRMEAMNAVLIASIAASTFNMGLEAWEPLIEPFDGIFKLETYVNDDHIPIISGIRMRFSTAGIVNVNISATCLEILVQSLMSWRRLTGLEHKLINEIGSRLDRKDISSFSALQEDDTQKFTIENKLGCGIHLKKVESNSETIEFLENQDCISMCIPLSGFSDRLNSIPESKESRRYIAAWIFESRGLPIVDDGNSHDFFCALRLVVDRRGMEHKKLFPESARTRCVKPLIIKNDGREEGIAKWNELFIFEIPQMEVVSLEVEVTNLASKAGKGEVIGAFSIPVGNNIGALRQVTSLRMMQLPSEVQSSKWYLLRQKDRLAPDNGSSKIRGQILISTSYFQRKVVPNEDKVKQLSIKIDRGEGLWMAFTPDGQWENFGLLPPLSVVPRMLENRYVAAEVFIKNGRKHITLRGLTTVMNNADITFEVSVSPVIRSYTTSSLEEKHFPSVTEEVFENQRYQPISGWGNRRLGFLANDPRRWSTRDFSFSSMEFFEPPLPNGWIWTSSWSVEKSQFVDSDGWVYGTDFQNLTWPPQSPKSNAKSPLDFVRCRRWVRTRRQVSEKNNVDVNNFFTIMPPNSLVSLPLDFSLNMELYLQIRPVNEYLHAPYSWSHALSSISGRTNRRNKLVIEECSVCRKDSIKLGSSSVDTSMFVLNQLEKADTFFCCHSVYPNPDLWLSVGTDASVLHTELNVPVFDWKISLTAPLKLVNGLPCNLNFTIWEKLKDGNRIERNRGIISSCNNISIYSVDIRKQIYLTLFVQGGWILEKDAVLLLDPLASESVSSFWMFHQETNRKLRISIQRDMGGSNAAPIIMRLFVPYWIHNISSLPLAYRIVELDESIDNESLLLSRAVKSAKHVLRNPTSSLEGRTSSIRKNIQIFEEIEDTSPMPVMLSLQDYTCSSGLLSPRIGITITIQNYSNFSPGISFVKLEKEERLDIKVFTLNGSYYKLSTLSSMASDRTKVVRIQPHTLIMNRVGRTIYLQQCDFEMEETIHPTDPPKLFQWKSIAKDELLKVRLDGFKWSTPFSINNEGLMCVFLVNDSENNWNLLNVEVRSGIKSSRYEVIFRHASQSSPYRVENRSMILVIRFRQVGGSAESWKSLLPNSATAFFWEDLGRQRLLEISMDGSDASNSEKYSIDEVVDQNFVLVKDGICRAMHITVQKEGKMRVVKISDLLPENESTETVSRKVLHESSYNHSSYASDSEFHLVADLTELGLSLIDHTPEEILYLSMQKLTMSYSASMSSGISRFKFQLLGIQVDNQLPLTPMPVLFRPQRTCDQINYLLKFSLTRQSSESSNLFFFPYLGFEGPENTAFLVNIHEPIIWRLHEMIQRANLKRINETESTAVSVDPIVQIKLFDVSEIRFKVSMAMSPTQRPSGVLGFWLSLMTALGNTEHMPVRINPRFRENLSMRKSVLLNTALMNIKKDLLSQPLQLLTGVDILGNASSALGHMSKGVAALSMDKKFIQSRMKQDSKYVEDIGDVIREGGSAFAKGLFRGVTGILTKPLEGAKSSGVEGFVQGVGKGIIGVAAQPVSGVLDLLSKTTEGANAMKMKITSAITSEEQLLRRRLPRVISGDNVLQPYDEYKSTGQAILQLAECGTFFGQVDLFKVRGKYALSDSYEDHYLLPKGKVLVVTHRRVILLQQPSNIMSQRKFSPARDPCSVIWDVSWDDLETMELSHGKKDGPSSPPSRLILYLQISSNESKEYMRAIKCKPESLQASDLYTSIDRARNTYGPNHLKETQKGKALKPYSPCSNELASEVSTETTFDALAIQEIPSSLPVSSTFGAVLGEG